MKCQNKDSRQAMLLMLVRLQKSQDGGYVMVVVIFMLLILTSLLAAFMLLSKAETASTKATTTSNTGYYAAESGLNLRAKQVQDKFQGFNRPSGTSPGTSPNAWQNCLDADTTNDGSGDFACSIQTFNGQRLVTYVVDLTAATPLSLTIPAGEPFAGLSAQEYRYDVTSVALDSQDLPTSILGMRFKSRVVPMFQFVAFYGKDLELAYPPTMTLNGRVHSNGDMYLNSNATLTINGEVSTIGTLYRGLKFTPSCGATVRVFNPSTATSLACGGSGSSRRTYSNSQLSSWNNMIRVGVDNINVPPADSFDPTPGKTYWDKADLRVVLQLDTSGNPIGIDVRNQNDTQNTTATNNLRYGCSPASTTLASNASTTTTALVVSSLTASTGFAAGDLVTVGNGSTTDYENNVISNINLATKTITLARPLGSNQPTGSDVRKALVSTSNTFFNNREKRGTPLSTGTTIRMLEVDTQGVLNCIQAHKKGLDDVASAGNKELNDDTDGGLVWFLTVKGSNSSGINDYGVRLRNGSQLASTVAGASAIQGLSVISDQPVYIKGNYNSTNKKPAAVMTDAINILSNNWNMSDSTSTGSLSGRTATATTVNAAFLAGTDTTGGADGTSGQDKGYPDSYGGGLENFPRFHENWSVIDFNYRGSFVSLNAPLHVNGKWCGSGTTCNIYNPPSRLWDFDTDFNNAANLPPVTPRFVYLRQENFTRNFDR